MALDIKTQVKELSTVERELVVAIAGSAVAKELDRAYRSLAQKVRLKGFRQGKVPRYVLEQYYKDDTERGVLEKIVGDSFRQAIKDQGLKVVSDPDIKAKNELIPGVDYTYSARIEVKPEIEIKQHKGLKLTKKVYTVDDDAVQARLESMRERQVQVVPVEDRDTIQQGDLVECNFSGTVDGEAVRGLGGVSFVVEVGAGRFYPEAEQALVGKKIREPFEVDIKVPDDFRVEAVRGKTATLKINPSEIKRKDMPELDDEFAKDVSDEYETLDDLKSAIKKDLEAGLESRTKRELREAAVDALIEANPFEVPASLVERQAQQIAADSLGRMPQQLAERMWQAQGQRLTDDARPRALRSVRGGLLLEKLVELESVEVSDDELDERLAAAAAGTGQSVKQVKKLYQRQPGALDDLRAQLATEKMLDRVIEAATVEEVKASLAADAGE